MLKTVPVQIFFCSCGCDPIAFLALHIKAFKWQMLFLHKFQTYDKDLNVLRLDDVGGAGFGGGAGRRDLAAGLGKLEDIL